MSSGFERPITIKEAITKIEERKYLLPAIQRKFIWRSDQIEVLFDSLMRGYPINSFMLWEVKDKTIKNKFKFYEFLLSYREKFKEDNPDINTKGYKDFFAVIDGQQRLTSIYIGLKGTFAYKLDRKWWFDTEESIPTRYMYLDIASALPEENERQMIYDFQFLTDAEVKEKIDSEEGNWYKVSDIMELNNEDELDNFIDRKGLSSIDFSKKSLRKLWRAINIDPLINYYLEKSQDIDTVLDIFIRTNSGGEPLSFSDLLMSITTAQWTKRDARKEITDVVNKVFGIGNPGFIINKDFVLKTCLVLFSDNIKFSVKNFDHSSVVSFESNWLRIKKSIIETFTLLAKMGFNNSSLRAKNAAIPIIYFIYSREIEKDINNPLRYAKEKLELRKWLCLSMIKGVFGGQSDYILTGIKKVIKAELSRKKPNLDFPLAQIKEEFRTNPTKNLTLDDELIEGLLLTQKDDVNCFPILSLLYSHFDFNQSLHKDHLHPEDYFRKLKSSDDKSYLFYSDPENWNSILNLQLLNSHYNQSKLNENLMEWVRKNKVDLNSQLIPKDVDLSISNFKEFIKKRKQLLTKKIKEIV